jgi:hypothetical protein
LELDVRRQGVATLNEVDALDILNGDDMRKRGLPSPDRADAAPMNVESHAGESITGDLMTKAW